MLAECRALFGRALYLGLHRPRPAGTDLFSGADAVAAATISGNWIFVWMKGKGYDFSSHNDIERAAAFLNHEVPSRRQHFRSTSSERGLVAVAETLTASPLDDDADKFDLLSRLGRHKLFFCGIFLLTLGFMGAIYVVVPRTYQGQASIILAAAEPVLRGMDPVVEQRH